MKRFLAIALILCATHATADTYRWAGMDSALNKTTDDDWADGLNWSNVTSSTYNDGFPDGAGDVAQFNQTNVSPNQAGWLDLEQSITLGIWTNMASDPYSFIQGIDTANGSTITMDNNGSGAVITYPNAAYNDGQNDREWSFTVELILADDLLFYWNSGLQREIKTKISGTGDMTWKWRKGSSGGYRFSIENSGQSNTYSGNTYWTNAAGVGGASIKRLRNDGAIPAGDVVMRGVLQYLEIMSSGGAEDRIDDACSVYLISSGSTYTYITLNSGVTETINKLYWNGVSVPAGTWGNSASAAANMNNNWFKNSGVLTVLADDWANLVVGMTNWVNVGGYTNYQAGGVFVSAGGDTNYWSGL